MKVECKTRLQDSISHLHDMIGLQILKRGLAREEHMRHSPVYKRGPCRSASVAEIGERKQIWVVLKGCCHRRDSHSLIVIRRNGIFGATTCKIFFGAKEYAYKRTHGVNYPGQRRHM